MPRVAGREINWNELDLTRDAKELAAELGCHTSIIYRMRKKAGVVVPKKSGGPREGFGGAQHGAGRPKKEPMGANVFVRLEADELSEVDRIATEDKTTRSKVIRAAVREFIEKRKDEIWGEGQ